MFFEKFKYLKKRKCLLMFREKIFEVARLRVAKCLLDARGSLSIRLKMILRLFLFLFGSSAMREIWRTVKL